MTAHRRRRTLAVGAALLLGSAMAAVSYAGPAGAAGGLDNPYASAKVYVNPDWSARASADGGSSIADQPTFVWLDNMAAIGGTGGNMGLRAHLDDALAKGANLIQFVIYDLPNRDCAALASNGEIPSGGLSTYEHNYIDPIVGIMADTKYAGLRIVNLIEPDSLPNLVTNADNQATATAACRQAKQTGEYLQGVGYALAKLGALANVYNYIDAGHHAWLGWDTNFQPFGQVALQAATTNGATVADVAGFITNTANYSTTQEPNFKVTDTVNGSTVRQAKWIDWNNYVDELSYAQALRGMLVSAGFNPGLGMLIDTGRNGWGGTARPTGPGPTTSVDAYVDGGRLDRRIHAGNWCNQTGSGIGARPAVSPAAGIDAYVWAKPPGESDGDTRDGMCDPDYPGNPRNGNNRTGALPGAPAAGQWFSAEFHMLLNNAFPPLGGGGGGDTSPPSTPANLAVTGTTASSVSLSWTASTDNVGVTGYDVYRGATLAGSATATTFTDSGLAAGTSYPYTVRARDAAGNVSAASTGVTATTSGGGGGSSGCTASYHVDNDWGSGFVATVTVTNSGTRATTSWRATWTFGGSQRITNAWNTTLSQSGASVSAGNAPYNGVIGIGASTTFGFQGGYSGANAVPALTCTAT
jgi:cellulose 1,4-beta-cellobiosidase